MELTFIKEDVPKVTRAGGSGREAEPWEAHLAPLKESPGESFRVWTYGDNKRSSAISRKSAVKDRLRNAVPAENWQLDVRPVPDAENTFGVYVTYVGQYGAEQIVANAKAHSDRSERVRASRAAAKEAREVPEAPAETAKSKATAPAQRKAS